MPVAPSLAGRDGVGLLGGVFSLRALLLIGGALALIA